MAFKTLTAWEKLEAVVPGFGVCNNLGVVGLGRPDIPFEHCLPTLVFVASCDPSFVPTVEEGLQIAVFEACMACSCRVASLPPGIDGAGFTRLDIGRVMCLQLV